MKTWRCAICKATGEAIDARQAEKDMVAHWREYHFNVRKDRHADHAPDAG
jgi:hypothetical protein